MFEAVSFYPGNEDEELTKARLGPFEKAPRLHLSRTAINSAIEEREGKAKRSRANGIRAIFTLTTSVGRSDQIM